MRPSQQGVYASGREASVKAAASECLKVEQSAEDIQMEPQLSQSQMPSLPKMRPAVNPQLLPQEVTIPSDGKALEEHFFAVRDVVQARLAAISQGVVGRLEE